jgi:hypothetical protein
MAYLIPLCYLTALDNLGAVVSGARGYIYDAGTTNAKQTYSDYILASANAIPYITADSAGRFPPAYVADGTVLRFLITGPTGSPTYHDHDNVLAPVQASISSLTHPFVSHAANFTVDASMNGSVRGIDCSSGDVSVDLNEDVLGNGFEITFVKTNVGGGTVVISSSGSGTFNGESSYIIDTPYESVTLDCIGTTGWLATAATSREEMGEIDIVEYTGSITLQLSDKGKLLRMNSAGAMNVSVPTHAAVPFAVGTRIEGIQYNTGEVTIVGIGGVNVRSPGGFLKTLVQYSEFVLTKNTVTEWFAAGDLEL